MEQHRALHPLEVVGIADAPREGPGQGGEGEDGDGEEDAPSRDAIRGSGRARGAPGRDLLADGVGVARQQALVPALVEGQQRHAVDGALVAARRG